MPDQCGQEMCPNWGGDVCLCVLFDLERPTDDAFGDRYDRYGEDDDDA